MKAIVDIPEVKTIIGESKICGGCLSSTCLIRQNLSIEIIGRRFIIRYCRFGKALLNIHSLKMLQQKVERNSHVFRSKSKIPSIIKSDNITENIKKIDISDIKIEPDNKDTSGKDIESESQSHTRGS